ncbi:hypothetical protein MACK_000514 [Theileria orientalis]|uniref:SfiI-subtelomeric related protein family member n=1 Tax=Theileria orientalis TaxID=68886 RepID=A0A976QT89_THEOR|nr:hypothetical protein MACK_000514 [Theileria orientalis]
MNLTSIAFLKAILVIVLFRQNIADCGLFSGNSSRSTTSSTSSRSLNGSNSNNSNDTSQSASGVTNSSSSSPDASSDSHSGSGANLTGSQQANESSTSSGGQDSDQSGVASGDQNQDQSSGSTSPEGSSSSPDGTSSSDADGTSGSTEGSGSPENSSDGSGTDADGTSGSTEGSGSPENSSDGSGTDADGTSGSTEGSGSPENSSDGSGTDADGTSGSTEGSSSTSSEPIKPGEIGAIQLDLKDKKSTNSFDCLNKDGFAKYTPKSGYGFSLVKGKHSMLEWSSKTIWSTSEPKDYATAVVRDGTGMVSQMSNVTIFFGNNHRHFVKSDNKYLLDSDIRLNLSGASSTSNQPEGTQYTKKDDEDVFTFDFNDDSKCEEVKFVKRSLEGENSSKVLLEEVSVWKHHEQLYGEKHPKRLRYYFPVKMALSFDDSFIVYSKNNEGKWDEEGFFDFKLFSKDSDNKLEELDATKYDIAATKFDHVFTFKENVKPEQLKHKAIECWNYSNEYPSYVRYKKDGPKFVLSYTKSFVLYEKDSDTSFKNTEFSIKLYHQDSSDPTKSLELHGADYNLNEEDDKFTFVMGENVFCSLVKMDGKELSTNVTTDSLDSYPTDVIYWKDRKKLIFEYQNFFFIYQKDDNDFENGKRFDLKLFSIDPTNPTLFVPLNHSKYDLIDDSDIYEFMFKDDPKCGSIKLFGNEIWKHDSSKHGDEFPLSLSYKKDGSKLLIDSEKSFVLCNRDGNEFKVNEFFIKLYRLDPNDDTKILELQSTDYKLIEENDKFTFAMGKYIDCSMVKVDGNELWKHDSSNPEDSHPTDVFYWKDRKKVILEFPDSFNLYQKSAGGGFENAKRFDLKLYSKDPNDEAQFVPLNHSKYDLIEDADKFGLKFKDSVKCVSVFISGIEVWKHDPSILGNEYPLSLRYKKDGSMLSIDFDRFFVLCNRDGNDFKVNEFFIKLFTLDSATNELRQISFSDYQINEFSEEFEFKIKREFFCDEIKFNGNTVWNYDPKKYKDEYPSIVRYKKDGSKFVLLFRDSFLLFEVVSDNKVKYTEFFIKLYQPDPNDSNEVLELHTDSFDINDINDTYTFVLGKNIDCSMVKVEGRELWKYDPQKPADSHPAQVFYWKDLNKVILDFLHSFYLYQKGAGGSFENAKRFDLKLYSEDPNDKSQLVPLNHSKYDLIEDPDKYELMFKDDPKCGSIQLSGTEIWRLDSSKHGDDYPLSLRYKKDGSKLSIHSERSFVLCSKDVNEFKVHEFSIKLFTLDSSTNIIRELSFSEYRINEFADEFEFEFQRGQFCDEIKFKGNKVWTYDAEKFNNEYPSYVRYKKDGSKFVIRFRDSFVLFEVDSDDKVKITDLFIKLFQHDPNDSTQVLELHTDTFDIKDNNDFFSFALDKNVDCSIVRVEGKELWKYDSSKDVCYPSEVLYWKDRKKVILDFLHSFYLYQKGAGGSFETAKRLDIKLYSVDPNDISQLVPLNHSKYDLVEDPDKYELMFKDDPKCGSIQLSGTEIWRHVPSKHGDQFPVSLSYKKDGSMLSIFSEGSFVLCNRAGNDFKVNEFFIKLFTVDSTTNNIRELSFSEYHLNEDPDEFEFKFKRGLFCDEIKYKGSSVWTYDADKYNDEFPSYVRYKKDGSKFVVRFRDSFVLFEVDSDDKVKITEFFIKLFQQDSTDVSKTLELQSADYKLYEENDIFTFALDKNVDCSMVKMEGKELWKFDSSNDDCYPTEVLYWKDRKKVILDFPTFFKIYQKGDGGVFESAKRFDLKLYTIDPNDESQLVPLNHAKYVLNEFSAEFEFKFKRGQFCDEIKYKGFADSFSVYEKGSDGKFKITDFFIKLYQPDPNDSNNLFELQGADYNLIEEKDKFTFVMGKNVNCSLVRMEGKELWSFDPSNAEDSHPSDVFYWKDRNKVILDFPKFFKIFQKEDNRSFVDGNHFDVKLFTKDPNDDTKLVPLNHSHYELNDFSDEFEFKFNQNHVCEEVKFKGNRAWTYDHNVNKYPNTLRYKKDGSRFVISFDDSFAVYEKGSDDRFQKTEFFIKLYKQDSNDLSKSLELHSDSFDVTDENDIFSFDLDKNVKCSLVKMEGKELWKHDPSNPEDSHPTHVFYWKDRRKVILDFPKFFKIYQKGVGGKFDNGKLFDIKLYSKDPNDETLLVPLNHSKYDIIEDADKYGLKFKDDPKCCSIKLSGNEIWRHDHSKHGDEYPVSLRYKKDGSKLLIDSEGYFVLCSKDGNDFKVNEFFIKLYTVDSLSNVIRELSFSEYQLNEHSDEFEFEFKRGQFCDEIKYKGNKIWTYDSTKYNNEYPSYVRYKKDGTKFIVGFADSFAVFEIDCDGNFKKTELFIKLYQEDPSDASKNLELQGSDYVLKEENDIFTFALDKNVDCSMVKMEGKELWKFDSSIDDSHPTQVFYWNDRSKVILDFPKFFKTYQKDDNGEFDSGKQFDVKLYSKDPKDDTQLVPLNHSTYELVEATDKHEYKFKEGVKCGFIKLSGSEVWKHDTSKHGDEYPQSLRYYFPDKLALTFDDSFMVYTKNADGKWEGGNLFDFKLYAQDSNNVLIELDASAYDISDHPNEHVFDFNDGINLQLVKNKNTEFWKYENKYPNTFRYKKDGSKFVMGFDDSFAVYELDDDGNFQKTEFLIKLYQQDPNDSTQVLELQGADYEIKEQDDKFTFLLDKIVVCSMVKVEGKELWKHDHSNSDDSHPTSVSYWKDGKNVLIEFPDCFKHYQKDDNGEFDEGKHFDIKLYSKDPNDDSKFVPLNHSTYDLIEDVNKHEFRFKEGVKCVSVYLFGSDVWIHDTSKHGDEYPQSLRYYFPDKLALTFDDSFMVYTKNADGKWEGGNLFDFKLYAQDSNNVLIELDASAYDISDHPNEHVFDFNDGINLQLVKNKNTEFWKYENKYPNTFRYKKDGSKFVMGFDDSFAVYELDDDGNFQKTEFLIKLYQQDPNDSTQDLELQGADYDLKEENDIFTFVIDKNIDCSMVKVEGKELWKHDPSNSDDSHPTSVSYWKDGKNVLLDFPKFFKTYQKDDNGEFDSGKQFDVKLYSKDPKDDTQLVPLNHSTYELVEATDKHEYKFKEGVKCGFIKLSGSEVWKHDTSKHGDEYPQSLRYYLNDKLALTFDDSFMVYTKNADGKWEGGNLFDFKLYAQDSNNVLIELDASAYDISDHPNEHVFDFNDGINLQLVKNKNTEFWKYENKYPNTFRYKKDGSKFVMGFDDSFAVYELDDDGNFQKTEFLIKLYQQDPNDSSKCLELHTDSFQIKDDDDKYSFVLDSNIDCSTVKVEGKELWKHDPSNPQDPHPTEVVYWKDMKSVILYYPDSFSLYQKGENGDFCEVKQFDIKLFSKDPNDESQLVPLNHYNFELIDCNDDFEFKFNKDHNCDMVIYKGNRVWIFDPNEPKHPLGLRYKKDGSKFVMDFHDSFVLHQKKNEDFKKAEFNVELYQQDPNDPSKTVGLGFDSFEIKEENDNYTLVIDQKAGCSMVKVEGQELWKQDPNKPEDSNPTAMLFFDNSEDKMVLYFEDRMTLYQKVTADQFDNGEEYDIKLYTKDDENKLRQLQLSEYELNEFSDDFEFKFNKGHYCEKVIFKGSKAWSYDPDADGSVHPLCLRYRKDGTKFVLSYPNSFVLYESGSDNIVKKSEFFIKLFQQDPKDPSNSLELRSADYNLNEENDKFTFAMGKYIDCSMVKVDGNELWKHDSSNPEDSHPTSVSYWKDRKSVILYFPDSFNLYQKGENGVFDHGKHFDFRLYSKDPKDDSQFVPLNHYHYELIDFCNDYEFKFNKGHNCDKIYHKSNEVWCYDPNDGKYPNAFRYKKDGSKFVMGFDDSFAVYELDDDGNFQKTEFLIKLYQQDPNDSTQVLELQGADYDLKEENDIFTFVIDKNIDCSMVKVEGKELWKHDPSNSDDSHPTSVSYWKDGKNVLLDFPKFFKTYQKDDNGEFDSGKQFDVKLYSKDPKDDTQLVPLNHSTYELVEATDKHEYKFKEGVKCGFIKLSGSEVWKHDTSKHGDEYPQSLRYYLNDKLALTFDDSFMVYTKNADGKWEGGNLFDFKLYAQDSNNVLIELDASAYDISDHPNEHVFDFNDGINLQLVKNKNTEFWKYENKYPNTFRYKKDGSKFVMGFDDSFAVYELDDDGNFQKTEFLIKLYQQDPNDSTQVLELQGADYDLKEENDIFTFVIDKNIDCSMVKVEGKELWKHDPSNSDDSHPTSVSYWKDGKNVLLDFPKFFKTYQKDDKGSIVASSSMSNCTKDQRDTHSTTEHQPMTKHEREKRRKCVSSNISSEVWKHDTSKHGDEYPQSSEHLQISPLYHHVNQIWKMEGGIFNFKLYAQDSNNVLIELDASAYDISDFKSDYFIQFKPDVKLKEVKNKDLDFWKYENKYPNSFRYKKDGSKFVMGFDDSFAVYELDDDGNFQKTEFLIKLYQQPTLYSISSRADYDLKEENDFHLRYYKNIDCSMVKVEGKELWKHDPSNSDDSHPTSVSYWKDGKNVLLDFPKFFKTYQKDDNGEFDSGKQFDVKLYSKDPKDDTQLVPLNHSTYELVEATDKHEYKFKEGVKCGFIKLSGSEVWKHDTSKHGDEYPQSLRYYLNDKLALTFDDSFMVYTKNADGKWEGGNLFDFKLYAQDSNNVLIELDASAYDISDHPNEHVFDFNDGINLQLVKNKNTEFWKYENKYPNTFRYKKDGSKFVMGFDDSFAVYELDDDGNFQKTEFLIKLYQQDPNDSTQVLELQGADYELKEEEEIFAFVLGKNVKCSLVKVEGKELWKHDSSKSENPHPVEVLYSKDGNSVVIDFPKFFMSYQKDENGQFDNGKQFDVKLYSKDPNDDTQLVPLNRSKYDLIEDSTKQEYKFKDGVNCGFIKISGSEVWKHDRHIHHEDYPKRLRYYLPNKMALGFDHSFIVYSKDNKGKWDKGISFDLKMFSKDSNDQLIELDATDYDIRTYRTEYSLSFKTDVKLWELHYMGKSFWSYDSTKYNVFPSLLRYKIDGSALVINIANSIILLSKDADGFKLNEFA